MIGSSSAIRTRMAPIRMNKILPGAAVCYNSREAKAERNRGGHEPPFFVLTNKN